MNETKHSKTVDELREEAGWITNAEAARRCGVTTPTFDRWWRDGKVPIERFRVGKVVRFSKWDFDEWQAAQMELPPNGSSNSDDDSEEDEEEDD